MENTNINKSEEHIIPQDNINRFVSMTTNEDPEGLLVKFTDDRRSRETANALERASAFKMIWLSLKLTK